MHFCKMHDSEASTSILCSLPQGLEWVHAAREQEWLINDLKPVLNSSSPHWILIHPLTNIYVHIYTVVYFFATLLTRRLQRRRRRRRYCPTSSDSSKSTTLHVQSNMTLYMLTIGVCLRMDFPMLQSTSVQRIVYFENGFANEHSFFLRMVICQ